MKNKPTAFLVIAASFIVTNAFFIESKLDGLVLTVSHQKVPPKGPYQRNGVFLSKAIRNQQEQQWEFIQLSPDNPNEGLIGGYGNNAISTGLLGDNQFAFSNIYNVGNMTKDNGYRLLIITSLSSKGFPRCVKNPGNGGFHDEVECNLYDDSQLWRFAPAEAINK